MPTRLLPCREVTPSPSRPQASHGLRTIRELQRGSSGVIVLAEEASGDSVAVKLLPREIGNNAVRPPPLPPPPPRAYLLPLAQPHFTQPRAARAYRRCMQLAL